MSTSRAKRTSPSRPYDVLFQMVIGKWISQALGAAVEIGVPDQLARGERQCSDIAREAGVSEDGLYRLLRALASVGLFAESADRRFRLTGMGQLLRSDHPESLAGFARFTAHDITWRPWGQLVYSVKTGMPAFDHTFKESIFEHFSRNPEVSGFLTTR
jgi:Dimerisation domain